MPIHVLPDEVVSQIAAGEVVERPASVVKELIENAIDAGAQDIAVEIREGGKRLIRTTDDGCGIPSAEVDLAFQRHSTSKLHTADDLSCITTLGFRGEALASIAAVSRVTIASRSPDEPTGTLLRLEGGRIMDRQNSGRPPGTTVTMADLFFNVPARRKFLRSNQTEQRHVDVCVSRYAMAYPAVRFTLQHERGIVLQSPGNGKLRDVLVGIYGLEIGAALLDIAPERQPDQIGVTGLVSPPSLHRANRSYITLFVNGRWIQDASLTYAIVQAYHAMLPNGRYPLGVVIIELPPEDVDVNVHPTKAEVRFRDGDAVFRTVQKAVRRTVVEQAPARPAGIPSAVWPSAYGPHADDREARHERFASLKARPAGQQLRFGDGRESPEAAGLAAGQPAGRLPPLRVVGQLGTTYIVAEGPEGMYLLDQHAAHERVLFERLLAERQRAQVASQTLLEPQPVELAPELATLLEEHLEVLNNLGFQVEPFGGTTLLVRAVPAIAREADPAAVLEDIGATLLAGDRPLGSTVEEIVARQVCKQAAVKAGQVMALAEMEKLIRALEQSSAPHTCPHGRPTMIHLSVEHLARQFGR